MPEEGGARAELGEWKLHKLPGEDSLPAAGEIPGLFSWVLLLVMASVNCHGEVTEP